MVVFLRANEVEIDARLLKYINFCDEKHIDYLIFAWDRLNKGICYKNTVFCTYPAGYNLGSKAVLGRIKWSWYLLKKLINFRTQYSIIHACDFDTVLPAIFLKIFFKKKVIFDVFDLFSDTIKTNKLLLNKSIKLLESFALRHADYVFICEEERKKQLSFVPKNLYILPNIPDTSFIPISSNRMDKNKIIISYVGGFYKDRNLEILLKVSTSLDGLELHIAGFGDVEITEMVEMYAARYSNVIYYGKVAYQEGLKIMNRSNIIYAMYCKTNQNHIFAAPNKYYESLVLGKPLVTTMGTIVGDKVLKYDTGFVIEESYDDSLVFFKSLLFNSEALLSIKRKSANCISLWETLYKNYVKEFMNDIYSNIINSKF